MAILISFDIDGTLEVGDPPGAVTMDMVRMARKRGFITGSCSDRPMSTQRAIWREHDIEFDFVCYKHMLPNLKEDDARFLKSPALDWSINIGGRGAANEPTNR